MPPHTGKHVNPLNHIDNAVLLFFFFFFFCFFFFFLGEHSILQLNTRVTSFLYSKTRVTYAPNSLSFNTEHKLLVLIMFPSPLHLSRDFN